MKKQFIIYLVTSILVCNSSLNSFSQTGFENGTKYGKGDDSVRCIVNLSLYKERYNYKNYIDALQYWRIPFKECPKSGRFLYLFFVFYLKFLKTLSIDILQLLVPRQLYNISPAQSNLNSLLQ